MRFLVSFTRTAARFGNMSPAVLHLCVVWTLLCANVRKCKKGIGAHLPWWAIWIVEYRWRAAKIISFYLIILSLPCKGK